MEWAYILLQLMLGPNRLQSRLSVSLYIDVRSNTGKTWINIITCMPLYMHQIKWSYIVCVYYSVILCLIFPSCRNKTNQYFATRVNRSQESGWKFSVSPFPNEGPAHLDFSRWFRWTFNYDSGGRWTLSDDVSSSAGSFYIVLQINQTNQNLGSAINLLFSNGTIMSIIRMINKACHTQYKCHNILNILWELQQIN